MRRVIQSLFLILSVSATAAHAAETKKLIVAGGCFWCVESDFDQAPGVTRTISGYTGGHLDEPTYEQVTRTETGHFEAVEISYDPARTDYRRLLDIFWRTVDPTDPAGQFCDRGSSYRTAVFVATPEERKIAEESKEAAEAALGQRIVTPILDAKMFWPAETYHQNYYDKNPFRYKIYRWGCGRDKRVAELWGDAARMGLTGKH